MPRPLDEGARFATWSLALALVGAATSGWVLVVHTGSLALIFGLIGSVAGLMLGIAAWPGGRVESPRFRVVALLGASLNLLVLALWVVVFVLFRD